MSFNLGALGNRDIYPLMGQILMLSLLVKVIASIVLAAMHFGPRQIAGAALLLATPLTLLVAIAALGLELGALNDMESASVILVVVLTSLLFPTAFRRLGVGVEEAVVEAAPD